MAVGQGQKLRAGWHHIQWQAPVAAPALLLAGACMGREGETLLLERACAFCRRHSQRDARAIYRTKGRLRRCAVAAAAQAIHDRELWSPRFSACQLPRLSRSLCQRLSGDGEPAFAACRVAVRQALADCHLRHHAFSSQRRERPRHLGRARLVQGDNLQGSAPGGIGEGRAQPAGRRTMAAVGTDRPDMALGQQRPSRHRHLECPAVRR